MTHAMETFVDMKYLYMMGRYMYIFDSFSANKLKKFWSCRYKDSCMAKIHTTVETL